MPTSKSRIPVSAVKRADANHNPPVITPVEWIISDALIRTFRKIGTPVPKTVVRHYVESVLGNSAVLRCFQRDFRFFQRKLNRADAELRKTQVVGQ